MSSPLLLLYLAGVAVGLVVMRDPWPARLTTALVWPLGPMAFVFVVAILLLAAAILWPLLILALVALSGFLVWLF
jgi:hypothetical protein